MLFLVVLTYNTENNKEIATTIIHFETMDGSKLP